MGELEIIDCHVHAFPNEGMALYFMTRVAGRKEPQQLGTVPELARSMKQAHIARANILMFTPTTLLYKDGLRDSPSDPAARAMAEAEIRRAVISSLRENNQWAALVADQQRDLSYFCGVDPVQMNVQEILDEVAVNRQAWAKGVKIVPNQLRLFGNDPRLFPLFDYCEAHEIPILTQSGGRPSPQGLPWGHPRPFREALERFPNLRVVFSHMSIGVGVEELALLSRSFQHVYTDLSMRIEAVVAGKVSGEEMVKLMRQVGVNRVLFGTNFPLVDQTRTARAFLDLPLTSSEQESVANLNFKELVGETP